MSAQIGDLYSFLLTNMTLFRVAISLVVVAVIAAVFFSTGVQAGKKEDGEAFLAAKAQETGIYKLPSGMLIQVLKKGTGSKSPNANDDCDVHYAGTFPDGKKFDSSYDRGAPATFKPTQVIKGWTEALQLMREGDKWKVFIPYEIAYGASGRPPTIPAYSPLVFEMELIKVKGAGKPAADADKQIQEKLGRPYSEL